MGGREGDNLILIAVRAASVPSAGNKHYNHTGGTAGTSHSEAAELQQTNKQLQGSLPCFISSSSSTHPLFLWINSSSHLHFPFFSSLLPVFPPSFILSFFLLLLFSILTLLLSSIMDSLEISASCSGPCAPGASQAVLIPTPEESSRQR